MATLIEAQLAALRSDIAAIRRMTWVLTALVVAIGGMDLAILIAAPTWKLLDLARIRCWALME